MESANPHQPRPYLTIRPSSGWAALNLGELVQFRDLLTTLAGRDVKLRYRQTALGVIWVVLQPLLAAGIFSFVFGSVAKLPSDGIPYFLFAYAGLLGWNTFSATLTKASSALVGNANLVSKVFFPRLILPLSTVLSTLVDFGIALVMMGVLMVLYSVGLHGGILLLPVWLVLLLLLSMGLGLISAALMVSYRDVQYVLPVVTQFVLYASPVGYAVSAVPEDLRALYYVNPLAPILEGFRWSLLGRGSLGWDQVAYAAGVSVAVFLAGAFMFKRMERKFSDVI